METLQRLNQLLAGRYDIEREIGAGGMATVYLARDLRHDRQVALKVLNPELGAVLGVDRFLSEIRVTARLQHPNLLPLFDSGAESGLLFYVMPYVAGESLRARLTREHQLPVDDAVRIAASLASALEYAHRQGVIHRDLKPENILLQEGQPVIADFGIALAVSNAGGGRVTQTGISLGTPHYMSPEQATGDRSIDGRSDIYSLGAVLYEMLVGDPPFVAGTSQAIIAKLLTERPGSIRVTRPAVPEYVEAAVDHALEKLPADRFGTAREFADAITGKAPIAHTRAQSAAQPSGASERFLGTRARMGSPLLLATTALALALAAWGWLRPRAPSATQPIRFSLDLSDDARFRNVVGTSLTFSPDGQALLYVGGGRERQLVLRRLDELEARPISGTENARDPSFSPDGKWIAFATGNKGEGVGIVRVPVDGGPPKTLVPASNAGGTVSWGDNDVIIASSLRDQSLLRVPVAGGQPELLTTADSLRGETAHVWPKVLPGGKAVVFVIRSGSTATDSLAVMRLDDRQIHKLGIAGANPRYAAGLLLFGRDDGIVYAVPFDVDRLRTTGREIPVLDGVHKQGGAMLFAVSPTGALAYVAGSVEPHLVLAAAASGEFTRIPAPANRYATPRLSPDGRLIAVARLSPLDSAVQTSDVYVLDTLASTLSRFTTDGHSARPVFTPDGRHIAWRFADSARSEIRWQPVDRSAPASVLLAADSSRQMSPASVVFAAQGDQFAYTTVNGAVGVASLRNPTARRIIAVPGDSVFSPRLSSDGRWLAYTSTQAERRDVWIRPFPGPGPQLQVSNDGGFNPMWSPNGRELYYNDARQFVRATIVTQPSLAVTARTRLFDFQSSATAPYYQGYDVANDGRELVLISTRAENQRLVIATNWISELQARLASGARP